MRLKDVFSNLFERLSSQKLWKIQLISFVLVALIPLLFLSLNLYRLAWENAWREITEKHQLLATNMASPIENYVNDHRAMLKVIANSIIIDHNTFTNLKNIQHTINSTVINFKGYKSIALVSNTGQTVYLKKAISIAGTTPKTADLYREETCFLRTKQTLKPIISNIKPSQLDNKPTIILSEPILNTDHQLVGELIAELKIDAIESLRKKIHFGKKGHSAIVDATGHVIAHPNPVWMKEMKDLSSWKIVQNMMSGKTGVTEFYSPFIKANMVAGYTSVPGLGWGIMVPQPKSEITEQVNKIMLSNLKWGIVGLLFALGLSWLLVRWITRPIMQLSSSAQRLIQGNQTDAKELLVIQHSAPKEIQELSVSLTSLFHNLQNKNTEVALLNESLQQEVHKATEELRTANTELQKMAQSDHLTALASRRHFIDCLTEYTQSTEKSNSASVLLIDLDNFKDINDNYGHNAGDAVLVQIGGILASMGQEKDIFARYGGDEFSAILFSSFEKTAECAERIRSTIEQTQFKWQDHSFNMTVSIGVFSIPNDTTESILSILEKVDSALYEGKKSGRNIVVEFNNLSSI